MSERNFFAELKRRNVYKVAIAYAVVGWLLVQVATQVFPFFEIPNWAVRLVVLLIVVGFPIALILAWAFELTPEGIKRAESADKMPNKSPRGRAWIYVVLSAAALSLGLFFLGRFTASTKQSGPAEVSSKSIAVLPFESLSEDKGNAYFADGIQDEILARLSKIADLKVISRTSTQKYKSAPNNLREIAQQLGVSNILEGSVQKAGEQVRITVQLINALSDSHLWADTYDRKMTDIFGVESDVAQKIAGSLEAKLTGREKKEISFVGTKNPEAYDAVLHGLALRGSQRYEDFEKQRDFFQRAVELDPNYAQAWAYLGAADALFNFASDPTLARKEKARTAAETALRLAPDLVEGHMAMGIYKYYCLQDYDGALAELNIVRERAPNDWAGVFFTALVERRLGKLDESIRVMQQAAIVDPLNADIVVNLANTYRGMRKFEEARAIFDRALTLVPNDPNILAAKAETYTAQGDPDTAWGIVSKLKLSPADASFGIYMSILIQRRHFDEMLAQVQPILAKEQNFPPLVQQITHAGTALIYLMKGDRAAALPYVERARHDREDIRKNGGIPSVLYAFYVQMEACLGNRAEVEHEIEELFSKTRQDKWEFPNSQTTAASGYVLLGDLDRALPLLEDALSHASANSITASYLRLEPAWDQARHDPRFRKLSSETQ